jgi:hypothetical protein
VGDVERKKRTQADKEKKKRQSGWMNRSKRDVEADG